MSTMHYTTLARGFLSDSDQELYACPAGKSVIVKNVICVNQDVGDQTLNLTRIKSGDANPSLIFPLDHILGTREMSVTDEDQMLQPGDSIRGSAADAAVVSYVINGIIKDIA